MNWRLWFALVVLAFVPVSSVMGTYVVPEQGSYLRFVASSYGQLEEPGVDKTHPLGGLLRGQEPGGEFKFEVYSDETAALAGNKGGYYLGDFVTFCAETGEGIDFGGVYYFGDLEESTKPFADWIYFGHLTDDESGNVVPDHVPGTSRRLDTNAEGKDVQDALWRALSADPSVPTSYGWSDDVWDSWQTAFAADCDNLWSEWNLRDIDPRIAVLTVVPSGGDAQDLYVYIPRQGGIIPEPASLLIWSLLGGLAITVRWYRPRKPA